MLSIFIWRLVAKAVFHAVLPPTFRFVGSIFTLPNRRFYTPATDYEHVPTERGLHPIPSVIDLPLSPSVSAQSSTSLPRFGSDGLKLRNGNGNTGGGNFSGNGSSEKGVANVGIDHTEMGVSDEHQGRRKHYDADGVFWALHMTVLKPLTHIFRSVLTKVMVYVGIGLIASELGPVVFDFLGWNGVSRL